MYVGVGASRVRDLFRKARNLAKKEGKDSAIVFIDEIDVIGGKRGGGQGHQEYDQTLNQLLTEMDGMQTASHPFVLVIAATNRVDILDPALLRPGRFDRQIKVDLPDKEGRLHILRIQTRNKPIAEDIELESIAKETYGFSGAQLESLTNEAAILALRENKQRIARKHFRDAVDKVLLGEKTGKRPTAEELYRVAVHELGHAIMSELARPGTVAHITIAPRGNALGFVRQVPQDDSYLHTKDQLDGQIKVALAGAAAEELIFGNRSTGAQNDFMQASNLARTLVSCGLSDLGIVDAENLQRNVLDEEIRRILADLEKPTLEQLTDYRNGIAQLAEVLVEEESMSGDAFRQWLTEQGQQVIPV
jgi:ATP-dependent metalloprotease FtsH